MQLSRREILHTLAALAAYAGPTNIALAQKQIQEVPKSAGDTTVTDNEIPKELGCGFLTTTNQVMGVLIDTNGQTFKRPVAGSPYFAAKLIDKRSAFSEQITGSITASARFSGGGADAAAKMSKSIIQSELTTNFLVHKTVITNEYYIKGLPWREDARLLAMKSPKAFIQQLGDRVIDSVKVGGKMAILYTFNFSSREEAQSFNGKFTGNYGAGSGSADYQRNLFKMAQNSTMNIVGFVFGANNSPEIAMVDFQIDKRGRIKNKDQNLENILEFYNDFEDKVREADSRFPVELSVVKSVIQKNSVPILDLAGHHRMLAEAADINDALDKRISELEYLRSVALAWNQHLSSKQIEDMIKRAGHLQVQLQQEAEDIGSVEKSVDATLSVSAEDVPALPQDAWLPILRPHREYKVRLASAKAKSLPRDYDLPKIEQPRPCLISVNYSVQKPNLPFGVKEENLSDLKGEISVQILDKAGLMQSQVWSKAFSGPDRFVDKKHTTNLHFTLLDEDSAFVRVSATVENGTISVSGQIKV